MLTARHIRAARALLGWSAHELAGRAGVHLSTVQRMERSRERLHGTAQSFEKVQSTLEQAGIEFLDPEHGVGVRLRPSAASAKL